MDKIRKIITIKVHSVCELKMYLLTVRERERNKRLLLKLLTRLLPIIINIKAF